MYNCFDIHRCGGNGRQALSVYVYPIERFVVDGRELLYETEGAAGGISKSFYEFLDAIRRSPFYVPNPKDACIFVPSIDMFALRSKSVKDVEAALSSLEL
jgi:hypothetical protein